jgi:hypothetical protein
MLVALEFVARHWLVALAVIFATATFSLLSALYADLPVARGRNVEMEQRLGRVECLLANVLQHLEDSPRQNLYRTPSTKPLKDSSRSPSRQRRSSFQDPASICLKGTSAAQVSVSAKRSCPSRSPSQKPRPSLQDSLASSVIADKTSLPMQMAPVQAPKEMNPRESKPSLNVTHRAALLGNGKGDCVTSVSPLPCPKNGVKTVPTPLSSSSLSQRRRTSIPDSACMVNSNVTTPVSATRTQSSASSRSVQNSLARIFAADKALPPLQMAPAQAPRQLNTQAEQLTRPPSNDSLHSAPCMLSAVPQGAMLMLRRSRKSEQFYWSSNKTLIALASGESDAAKEKARDAEIRRRCNATAESFARVASWQAKIRSSAPTSGRQEQTSARHLVRILGSMSAPVTGLVSAWPNDHRNASSMTLLHLNHSQGSHRAKTHPTLSHPAAVHPVTHSSPKTPVLSGGSSSKPASGGAAFSSRFLTTTERQSPTITKEIRKTSQV